MQCAIAATVYCIWRERNLRVFQNKAAAVDQVTMLLANSIWEFFELAEGGSLSHQIKSLAANWNLADYIFYQ